MSLRGNLLIDECTIPYGFAQVLFLLFFVLFSCFACYFSYTTHVQLFFVHRARASISRAVRLPGDGRPGSCRALSVLYGIVGNGRGKPLEGGWLSGMLSSICGKGTAQCLSCAVPSGFLMSFSFVLNLQPGISPAGTIHPGSPGWTVPALPGRPAPGSGCWSRSPSG